MNNAILYGANACFNVLGLIGLIWWTVKLNEFVLWSGSYNFGWFSTITSLLISLFGTAFYGFSWVRQRVEFAPNMTVVVWLVIQWVYAVFMLATGGSAANVASACATASGTVK